MKQFSLLVLLIYAFTSVRAQSPRVVLADSARFDSLQQVVVTSLGILTSKKRSPAPVTVVSHTTIRESTVGTAIDLIASQPGVSETTEGVGTAKPQINGLGFDRVLVLTDGLPQEDFQWGDDHGVLIDPFAVYDAEIIRGPASLQYGGSAEAGVVNFKTAPFPASGTFRGSWQSEYHTNNGYTGNSLHLGANKNGLAYDLAASGELAHSYWDPKDGYVWGTAWNQANVRLNLGLDRSWGSSRLSISALYRRIQVPDGNRDSATGKFLFDNPVGEKTAPTLRNFLSYNATIAGDKLLGEYQAWWRNSINAGQGKIAFDLGMTSSVHHDIDSGKLGENNMVVYDVPFSLRYQLTDVSRSFRLTAGFNGMAEFMHNLPAPPPPYIADYEIPDYRKKEIGGFAIAEKTVKALTVSGGLRYDVTHFAGDTNYQFPYFSNTYAGWSGSIGATYQLPHGHYVKFNIAKSFRAPAINELTSNGLNIGSNAFQLGNVKLNAEQGYQADATYGFDGRDFSFEVDGFYNHIGHFIFADRTDSISNGYPVYEYVSSNTANLTGFTTYFNVHPAAAKWLEWNNRFSYVYTWLPGATDSTGHIPWIPAPHWHSEFRFHLADKPGGPVSGTWFRVGVARYWRQQDIYSALHTEVPSPAYTLVDIGFGSRLVRRSGKEIFSFYLNVTNLTNIGYADHLNLAQYFFARNGSLVTVTNQRQGIFNMGRDICFKIIVPFGSSRSKSDKGM